MKKLLLKIIFCIGQGVMSGSWVASQKLPLHISIPIIGLFFTSVFIGAYCIDLIKD